MRVLAVTRTRLRAMPLPQPDADGDKEDRGRVIAIGGSVQVPGAVLLAGVAALRAGAGKLQLATVKSAAMVLAMSVPEALVVALREGADGEIAGASAARLLRKNVESANAVLIGPGMSSGRSARALVLPLSQRLAPDSALVLDASAIQGLRDDAQALLPLDGRVVLTPHAGEMASLLGVDMADVKLDPAGAARAASDQFGAVVALKGSESWIAVPDGTLYRYSGGTVGLATSGSGDTLAGIVAGLLARGATAEQAAVWGVFVHGAAGRVLERKLGRIGFLARELLDEVPALLHAMR